MVKRDYMYVATPKCEVCHQSALVWVKIDEYVDWKAGDVDALSNPNYEVDQLVTGLHPDCANVMYNNGDLEEPLTPEEEEALAPPSDSEN
jgi:hypothetical protein